MDSRPTIVLVDDDDDLRELVAATLANDFNLVGEACDGEEALQVIADELPDLVLMDIEMPVMDGIEATTRLTQTYPNLVVVILSSLGGLDNMRRALAAGARDFVQKPCAPADLLETLHQAANHQRTLLGLHPEPVVESGTEDIAIGEAVKPPGAGLWAFARATGGVGQSTFILALANELVHQRRTVLVVDAHPMFGHLRFYLRLPHHAYNLKDLAEGTEENPFDLFQEHGSGIRVLGPPEQILEGGSINISDLADQILALTHQADYVLVDLPSGIPDAFSAVLDAARYLFVTTNGSPGTLKSTRDLLELFTQLEYPEGKLRTVLTGFLADQEVCDQFNPVIAPLGTKIDSFLPYDERALEQAMLQGHPVSRIAPKSDFSKAVRAYALDLIGLPPQLMNPSEDSKGSLLGNLLGGWLS